MKSRNNNNAIITEIDMLKVTLRKEAEEGSSVVIMLL